jgi:16S rRNA U516 pseudouridylate synthase RsuA-like enzyme
MLLRLNKFLAHSGVCSRREADRLIEEGRIKVNGRMVDELGLKIDPARDRVVVGGRAIRGGDERPVYILLYKPAGQVVTVKDPFGRPTVMDLLPKLPARVYPVGRLDAESEGVLLLTNDGETAFRLIHPKHEIGKIYEVWISGSRRRESWKSCGRGFSSRDGKRPRPRSKSCGAARVEPSCASGSTRDASASSGRCSEPWDTTSPGCRASGLPA